MSLDWPPAPPVPPSAAAPLADRLGHQHPLQSEQPPAHECDDDAAQHLASPLSGGLSDPRLIDGVAEITAILAPRLDDEATTADIMPVIRETARRWLEQQVRAGLLPASAGGTLDALATAVHDRRYGLGPLSAYLRDPQVENVDVTASITSGSPTPAESGWQGRR